MPHSNQMSFPARTKAFLQFAIRHARRALVIPMGSSSITLHQWLRQISSLHPLTASPVAQLGSLIGNDKEQAAPPSRLPASLLLSLGD